MGISVAVRAAVVTLIAAVVTVIAGVVAVAPARAAGPVDVDQGKNWTAATRNTFYTQDQGSQIMPLQWLRALKQPDGKPFLADSLARYGYLPNPASPTAGLPIGFTVNLSGGGPMVGMTCAACHTRQISVAGKQYRIDGGPALADFQSLLSDLDTAVKTPLTDRAAFLAFARAAFGRAPTPPEVVQLRSEVAAWYLRYHTLMAAALPPHPWGIGRLDAVGMIFNRLTGLDLGQPPSYLIPDNIRPADAPVRYPFLWNAPKQDFTQWPGFAENGSDLLGLARNLGEVYGVFADFAPRKSFFSLLGVDYTGINSANFDGLSALEALIRQLGPPKWPFAVDSNLARQGKLIFNRPTKQGGCVACHGIRAGITRFGLFSIWHTWATPIQDVGTDTREYQVLGWTADSGELTGASIPVLLPTPLKRVDKSFGILGNAVIGSIIDHYLSLPLLGAPQQVSIPDRFRDLSKLYRPRQNTAAYESRVLEGIWAAAPYLHNGSVPTLAQLLTPSLERVGSFAIGPAYDTANVGLAKQQDAFSFTLHTTGCTDVDSGNSHCGHDFGTTLPAQEKTALIEYLKTL